MTQYIYFCYRSIIQITQVIRCTIRINNTQKYIECLNFWIKLIRWMCICVPTYACIVFSKWKSQQIPIDAEYVKTAQCEFCKSLWPICFNSMNKESLKLAAIIVDCICIWGANELIERSKEWAEHVSKVKEGRVRAEKLNDLISFVFVFVCFFFVYNQKSVLYGRQVKRIAFNQFILYMVNVNY